VRLQLDSRLCISYLTIEHRGALPEAGGCDQKPRFRCDICRKFARSINRRDRAGKGASGGLDSHTGRILPPRSKRLAWPMRGFRRRVSPKRRSQGQVCWLLWETSSWPWETLAPGVGEILARLSRRDDVLKNEVLSTTLQRRGAMPSEMTVYSDGQKRRSSQIIISRFLSGSGHSAWTPRTSCLKSCLKLVSGENDDQNACKILMRLFFSCHAPAIDGRKRP